MLLAADTKKVLSHSDVKTKASELYSASAGTGTGFREGSWEEDHCDVAAHRKAGQPGKANAASDYGVSMQTLKNRDKSNTDTRLWMRIM